MSVVSPTCQQAIDLRWRLVLGSLYRDGSATAAAITGGKAVKTMWLTWKYTLPAFLVPFVFVLAPAGEALLLRGPLINMLWVIPVAALPLTPASAPKSRPGSA